MSDWKEAQFGELADVVSGYAFKSANFLDSQADSSLPVLKIKNVVNGDANLHGVQYHVYSDDLSKYLIKKGDVLVALTGNHPQAQSQVVGIASRYNLDVLALLNQRVAKVISKDDNKLCNKYIYYFLKDKDTHLYLASQSSGSANQANISKSDIENIYFSLPSPKEQEAIAQVLSSLDDKIDLLHRQNKTLEAIAETLFRQWFIEEAQDDWDLSLLEECVDIAIGRTPPRKEHQWFSRLSDDVKWISIKDLGNDGAYIFQTAECLSEEAVKRFRIPVIPGNTLVLSFKMTVGRVAITTEPMLSNEAIAHFKFIRNTPFTVEYLYFFLKNYRYETLGSTSSIVTSINSTMIKNLEVLIPDRYTMQKFDGVTREIFRKIRSNQLQIQTLEKLRDTLLPKLMSGEVRVAVEPDQKAA